MLARTRLGLGAGLATVTVAASLVVLAVPATAATPPPWDTGTTPTTSPTCTISTITSDPTHLYLTGYADTGVPTITDVQLGHGSTYVIGPGTTQVPVRVFGTETCGGVGDLRVALTRDTTVYISVTGMAFETTDAFHATMVKNVAVTTSSAGLYHAPFGYVLTRYSTFQLGVDFALVASAAGAGAYVSGPWSSKKLYLLLKTNLSAAASKTSVKKGRSVTFSTVLTKASGSTYANAAGETVVFQTRIGTKKWVTRATRTTTSAGAASYSFAPTSTMTWRWVHANRLTGSHTASSVSAVKTIKVT